MFKSHQATAPDNATIQPSRPATLHEGSSESIKALRRIIAGDPTPPEQRHRLARWVRKYADFHEIEKEAADDADKHALENCCQWVRLAADLGEDYFDATFDRFELYSDRETASRQRAAVASIREYASNVRENVRLGHGVVLFGPSGTGKDFLVSALARQTILKYGPHFRWLRGSTFAIKSRAAMTAGSEEDLIAEYTKPAILFFSDPQPPVGQLTQFQASVLFEIIDERNRQRRPTWVTLNVSSRADVDVRLGAAIADRMIDRALTLEMTWPSYRKSMKGVSRAMCGNPASLPVGARG